MDTDNPLIREDKLFNLAHEGGVGRLPQKGCKRITDGRVARPEDKARNNWTDITVERIARIV